VSLTRGEGAEIGPAALRMLGLEAGAEVEIRPVHSGVLGVEARGHR
jgi:hypothetical protein